MFRYIVLYALGGVYADLDVEPLKSLDPIRDWTPCILSQEPNAHHQVATYDLFGSRDDHNHTLACNAFMACRPGHPFFFYFLSRIVGASVQVTGESCPLTYTLSCTGPSIMSIVVNHYKRSTNKRIRHQPEDDVIVADADAFLPTFDEKQIGLMKAKCNQADKLSILGKTTCAQLKARQFANNKVTEKSYTNHHWFHTYFMKGKRKIFNISDVVPGALVYSGSKKDSIVDKFLDN